MRSIVSVSMEPELKKRLDRLAKQSGTQRSEIVSQALRRYVVERELELLREQIVPYARKAGYYTNEDIFRDFS